jgi:hypothetical protein
MPPTKASPVLKIRDSAAGGIEVGGGLRAVCGLFRDCEGRSNESEENQDRFNVQRALSTMV